MSSRQGGRNTPNGRNQTQSRNGDTATSQQQQQQYHHQQPENFFGDMMSSIQPLSLLRAIGEGQKEMIDSFHHVHSGGDMVVGPSQKDATTGASREEDTRRTRNDERSFSRGGSSRDVRSGGSANVAAGEREILPKARKFPVRQAQQQQMSDGRYDNRDQSTGDDEDQSDALYAEEGVDESAFCGNCQCPRNKCPSDCPLGGNRRRDIDAIRLSKGTKFFEVQYGFVATVVQIIDPKLLPFRATECDKILSLAPNTNWTFDEMCNALGVPLTITNGIIPANFVLANLPGNAAKYNGLYIFLGSVGGALKLLRLNWKQGSCKSPGVGTIILLRFGATAGTYTVVSIPDCNQRWILARLPLASIFFAEPIHMWANGTKYQFYDEEIDNPVC